MTGIDDREDGADLAVEQGSLWPVTLPLLVWAGYFLLCYAAAAIWCAKVGDAEGIAALRLGIGAVTLVALAAIALLGWRAARQWLPDGTVSRKVHRPRSRYRFLGHVTFLLSIIAFVAVIYGAMPALFIGSCR